MLSAVEVCTLNYTSVVQADRLAGTTRSPFMIHCITRTTRQAISQGVGPISR
jgi:hypothetical protein